MGAAEAELEAVVVAARYAPLSSFTRLADVLVDTHRSRSSVAADPG